jgi:hypothetical protein
MASMTRLISRLRGRTQGVERSNGNGLAHMRIVGPARQSASRARYVVTAAEAAPCTCPDFCERDHEND